MQTHSTIEPLQPKTWQLDATNGIEGYLYHCVLCDEALILSKHQINPQKIQIIFNNTCPGCSLELDKVLGCRPSILPPGRRLLTNLEVDEERVHERIHLSRAFTHHQVYNLIIDKLASALDEYKARLTVVSDITALFCDPDVRDKKESLDIFRKGIRFLATTAEARNILILITNLKARSKTMEDALTRTAHVSATLKDRGAYTKLTVSRHPFIPEKDTEVPLDNPTLAGYSQ